MCVRKCGRPELEPEEAPPGQLQRCGGGHWGAAKAITCASQNWLLQWGCKVLTASWHIMTVFIVVVACADQMTHPNSELAPYGYAILLRLPEYLQGPCCTLHLSA